MDHTSSISYSKESSRKRTSLSKWWQTGHFQLHTNPPLVCNPKIARLQKIDFSSLPIPNTCTAWLSAKTLNNNKFKRIPAWDLQLLGLHQPCLSHRIIGNNPVTLNINVRKLWRWCEHNLMSMNLTKSKLLCIKGSAQISLSNYAF